MSEKFEITVSDSKKIIFKNIRNLAGIVLVTPFFAHNLYTFRKRTKNSAGRFKVLQIGIRYLSIDFIQTSS